MTDPRSTVAATIRTIAEWGLMWHDTGTHSTRTQLLAVAEQVEHLEHDEMCCPVCEEVTCDEGCPLENWRQW